jgi:RNA polymerase sigma-70 factor (ECF subfamily)
VEKEDFHKTGWFEAFRRGDEVGFDRAFQTYFKAIHFFVNAFLKDTEAAADIAEECFLKLWMVRDQIGDEKHLRNWLYKTARHHCLRWRERQNNKQQAEKAIQLISEREEQAISEHMIRAETIRQMREAMEQLPAQCRQVFYKLYVEGKSVKETAQEMQVTESTVYNQKARGIKLLRLKMDFVLLPALLHPLSFSTLFLPLLL